MLVIGEFETANILPRDCDSGQAKCEKLGDRDFQELPCGGIVTGP
jgi:hypothetical protein